MVGSNVLEFNRVIYCTERAGENVFVASTTIENLQLIELLLTQHELLVNLIFP